MVHAHTLNWGALKEEMERLEKTLHANETPWMHTLLYQPYAFPNTATHNHALGIVQVTTGCKWKMDFKLVSLQYVFWIMA